MARGLYRGFSSHEFVRKRTFSLTDVELVKLDLLNFIYTPIGTRLNMPAFGTQIPTLVFEPLDEITTDTIRDELERAVNYDPRLQLLTLQVQPDYDNNLVSAFVRVLYIELNMTDVIYLNIDFQGSGTA